MLEVSADDGVVEAFSQALDRVAEARDLHE
jgi:hypothetical protein